MRCGTIANMTLQAILYERGSLRLLDQRLLPFEQVYLDVPTPQAAWQQIKDMVVRGAPAIGVTGALALAVHLVNGGAGKQYSSVQECVQDIHKTMDYLVTSRPTAVNLADSAVKLKAVADKAAAASGATPISVTEAVVAAAEAWMADDIAANKAIGTAGAAALVAAAKARGKGDPGSGKLRVLTHCNTGSLATAAYGTALGVIRALNEAGQLEHAYCTETRPYNQGARLTAYELAHDGLPATLICDSAAAALMSLGRVDAVVVGADRVVANGDTANKIGTYNLAIAAAFHNVPFFIAAPTTTLDADLERGEQIEIEQRPAEEITHFKGQRVVTEGIKVWNPCFDVTPGTLIEAIITEKGLVPKQPAAAAAAGVANGTTTPTPTSSSSHDVRGFMQQLGLWSATAGVAASVHGTPAAAAGANGTTTAATSSGSGAAAPKALDAAGVVAYLLAHPHLAAHVGPANTSSSWSVDEVGDGNINFVFIVKGPSGGLCLKQSLPFVRCVGEAWPLSTDRCRIEADALRLTGRLCPDHVPAVYHYDPAAALIAMQYLAPPAKIMRHGIVAGEVFPAAPAHIGEFLAASLFHTSALALSSGAFKQQVLDYVNPDLCALTESVVFCEPFCAATHNRWTSPELDADVAALQGDAPAKAAALRLKQLFCCAAQALVHGDLHTGSIMVTDTTTFMIDPEFAYVGPLAYDPAKILGELLIPFFASDGWEGSGEGAGARAGQRAWLLGAVEEVWRVFSSRFVELWSSAAAAGNPSAAGELLSVALVGSEAPAGAATLTAVQANFMAQLWRDVVSMAGVVILRRLVGIAHTADMDKIPDRAQRAAAERRALRFGRHLLVEGAAAYKDVAALVAGAAAARAADGLQQ